MLYEGKYAQDSKGKDNQRLIVKQPRIQEETRLAGVHGWRQRKSSMAQ